MLEFYRNGDIVRSFERAAIGDPIASRNPEPLNSKSVGLGKANLGQSDLQSLLDFIGDDLFHVLGYGSEVTDLYASGLSVPDENDSKARQASSCQWSKNTI